MVANGNIKYLIIAWMLRIFRPRHMMGKYRMYTAVVSYSRIKLSFRLRTVWINFRICGLSYDHSETTFFLLSPVGSFSPSGGNNYRMEATSKSFNCRKTAAGVMVWKINWKTLQLFRRSFSRVHRMTDRCYLFSNAYEYLIGYLWGFMLLSPSARSALRQ